MFADICQLPVETVDAKETGALGCAMTAAVAVGEFPSFAEAAKTMVKAKGRFTPNPLRAESYRARYEIYLKSIQALDPIWSDVQALV